MEGKTLCCISDDVNGLKVIWPHRNLEYLSESLCACVCACVCVCVCVCVCTITQKKLILEHES